MLKVFVMKNMIGCDWMVCMYSYDVYIYVFIGWLMACFPSELAERQVYAVFTEQTFETPQASVIYLYISHFYSTRI